MSNEPRTLREFVGFVWPEGDYFDQTGLLLMAPDSTQAAAFAREAYGDGFGVSVWNEEDARKPR